MKFNIYLIKVRLSVNLVFNCICYFILSIYFVFKYIIMIFVFLLSMILEKWFIVRVLIGVDIMFWLIDRIKVLEDGDFVIVGFEDFDKRL